MGVQPGEQVGRGGRAGLGDTRVSTGETELVMHKPWLGAADLTQPQGTSRERGV